MLLGVKKVGENVMNTYWDNVQYNKSELSGIDEIFQCNGLGHILSKIKDNAFVCLNVCVNSLNFDTFPEGYDLYVLSFSQEIFDEDWFMQVYNTHHKSRFLIIGNFYPGDLEKFDRVDFVRILDCLWYKNQLNYHAIDWNRKKFKISSLSYFITETRYFITAALLDKPDVLYSWHNQYRAMSPFEYIFQPTGNTNRDSLLKYKNRLDNVYQLDNFDHSSYVKNLQDARKNPAYRDSVVNCINETKDVSWQSNFGNCPTPYLSEKTWKAIYNGNALLFTSQANTERFLTELGFNFDYPWNNSYARIPGDLDRLEQLIELVNTILQIPIHDLISGVKELCEHNVSYFFSADFDKVVNEINNNGLERLEKIL